jgi:hypothetical protein
MRLKTRRRDSHQRGLSFSGKLGSLVEVVAEKAQLGVPFGPFLLRREQVVANVAEELDLHDVDLLYCDARDLGPRLIGVGVIVEV